MSEYAADEWVLDNEDFDEYTKRKEKRYGEDDIDFAWHDYDALEFSSPGFFSLPAYPTFSEVLESSQMLCFAFSVALSQGLNEAYRVLDKPHILVLQAAALVSALLGYCAEMRERVRLLFRSFEEKKVIFDYQNVLSELKDYSECLSEPDTDETDLHIEFQLHVKRVGLFAIGVVLSVISVALFVLGFCVAMMLPIERIERVIDAAKRNVQMQRLLRSRAALAAFFYASRQFCCAKSARVCQLLRSSKLDRPKSLVSNLLLDLVSYDSFSESYQTSL